MPDVVILPATPANTSPARNHWLVGLSHIVLPLIALTPLLLDAAIQLVNAGTIQIPPAWAGGWAIFVLAYHTYTRAQTEKQQQAGSAALQLQGIPAGTALDKGDVARALNTTAILPPVIGSG